MNAINEPSLNQKPEADSRNRMYVFTDAMGEKHSLVAGENGMTEEWISEIRHSENVIRSSDFHYYHRWNGQRYDRRVLCMDTMPPDALNRFSSMVGSRDLLTTLIEAGDQADFDRKFNAAMDSLTDRQWRLVYKRFELNMSDAEIAEEEGVSKMAISKRWDRIQAKINKIFTA